MPNEILKAMRGLREDMRQRLMQSPEYRALLALDRSIEEITLIMETVAQAAPEAAREASPEPATEAPQPAPAPQPAMASRPNAIASAFADTLAAKMDQRHVARAAYVPAARAMGG
jgi:hypothetical protein